MKFPMSFTTNILIGASFLGSVSMSYAATEAVVNVTATVVTACTISTNEANVDMGSTTALASGGLTQQRVTLTTNCGGGKGRLTLRSDDAVGDKIILKKAATEGSPASTLQVALKVGAETPTFSDGNYTYTPEIAQNTSTTVLTFSGVNDQASTSLNAGTYRTAVTASIAPL